MIILFANFYFMQGEITAYTLAEGNGDGFTASGTIPIEGRTIACDHLPFGTVVEINGHPYIVEDRFGAGYTNKFDIFMNSYHNAIQWGRQWHVVKIYQ